MRPPYNPPRSRPASLIQNLRDDAEDEAEAPYDNGKPELPQNTTAGEAAQMIEEWSEALTQIAAGTSDPQQVARDALKLDAPRKGWGGPDDTIRNLLKPRSV